eukprot:628452_1
MKRKSSFQGGSPSKKRKASPSKLAEGLLTDPTQYRTEFQRGQITKMTLTNWVTFDHTVIDCEPGLNLIVGPNGTGKSSVVCAIGLGLAGKPKCLGRGEKIADFIKYGREQAITNIELHNPDGRNYTIKRVISRKSNRNSWSLNGKKSNGEKVSKFVEEKLNIKVDNLCQFLAQDRVSEFADLTPKALLIETEKAINDQQLFRWHEDLIKLGEKAATKQNDITNLQKTLAQNESEIAGLQKTIEQFESQKTMKEQMKTYQALHDWEVTRHKHKQWKKQHKETERIRREYTNKQQSVDPLRKQMQSWSKKMNAFGRKHTTQNNDIKKMKRRKVAHGERLEAVQDKIETLQNEMEQVAQDMKVNERQRKNTEADIGKIQSQLDGMDEKEIEEAKTEKNLTRTELRQVRSARDKIKQQIAAIPSGENQTNMQLQDLEKRLQRYQNSVGRRDDVIFNRRQKDKQFFDWVQKHRHEFRGDVYGPIVREMTVRDDTHAMFLNDSIGPSMFYGYVCSDAEDWELITKQTKRMGLQCTIINNSRQNASAGGVRSVDRDTLRNNGVDGYLDELFEAQDIIKRVLNDNAYLNTHAYAMNDVNVASLDRVLMTHKRQRNRLTSLITPSAKYTVKQDRYSNQVMRKDDKVGRHPYPILQKTKDYSQEILNTQTQMQQMKHQLNAARDALKQVVAKYDGLQSQKKELETKINSWTSMKKKLARKQKKLDELIDAEIDPNELRENLTKQIQKVNMNRIIILDKLSNELEALYSAMKRADCLQINRKHCDEERKMVEKRIKHIQKRHQDLKKALQQSEKQEKKLKDEYRSLLTRVRLTYPRKEFQDKINQLQDKHLKLDGIQDKINQLQGRINVLLIDEERVVRYGRLEKKIATQKDKLYKMEAAQNKKDQNIREIEDKWAPQLQEAVDKISNKFGEFFAQFNKAEGQIELVRDVDGKRLKYSEWHIDILTKFREDQPFIPLTSSSQSGGEKSVSTMLYLLSLQQVTTVPFRVVDEINQGMDPINERRIMQILNFECTPAARHRNWNDGVIRHLPQYFVVTPKLLPRLEYSPCSNVFVIFNGPFQMPQEYWKMNEFCESQQALTGAAASSNDDDDDEDTDYESD